MTDQADTTAVAHSVAGRRIKLLEVVAAALGTYRRRFLRVAAAAVLIMVPVDLVVSVLEDVVRLPEGGSAAAWSARLAVVAANTAAAALGTTFFAGMLDRVVAVDQHGCEDAPLLRMLREVPVVRLVLVDLAAVGLVVLGIVAFIVPGLILLVLFGVVGPVLVIEDLRVWPALKRSARLVWPHFFLVVVLVLLPTTLEEALVDWAERAMHGDPALWLVVDVALTAAVASLVGILEVTLAHGLVADRAWRRGREAAAAGPATGADTERGAAA